MLNILLEKLSEKRQRKKSVETTKQGDVNSSYN